MRFILFLLTVALLAPAMWVSAEAQDSTGTQPEQTNQEAPKPEGPIRMPEGPRDQWTAERWLDEAAYLEGEDDLTGAVDALWTAIRLGGGGQRHAYGLGQLLLRLRRGGEAWEALCLARLGTDDEWRGLAEERLSEMGAKAPDWCSDARGRPTSNRRRNAAVTSTAWAERLKRDPCARATNAAWIAKRAGDVVKAIAMFGEAQEVCPDKQRIELEVAYCLLALERPDAASLALFEVTLGPDSRLARQAARQLSVMPKPSPEERKRREEETAERRGRAAKSGGGVAPPTGAGAAAERGAGASN